MSIRGAALLRNGLLLLAAIAAAVPFGSRPASAAIDAQELADVGFEQRPGSPLPRTLRFRDQDGRDLTSGDLVGDLPLVIAPVYYECPNLCGLTLQGLAEGLQQIDLKAGRDYRVALLGIDPAETPGIAARHRDALATRFPDIGIREGWTSLTGEQAAIAALTDAIGFRYAYDDALDQYAHTAGIVLVTPDGVIDRYLFGVEYRPRDLTLGLVETGKGRIGGVLDQVLLLCYDYNPRTGEYSLLVMQVLRWAGIFTAAALILLIAALSILPRWRSARGRDNGEARSMDGSHG